MKFKLVTVMVAAAVLSFTAAGPAVAQSQGTASGAKPAPPPQVAGSRLATAMLPASAFGQGFMRLAHADTGSKLDSTHATMHIPNLSCGTFDSSYFISFLGDTAGAALLFDNPNPASSYPYTISRGLEDVLQFATAASAATIYNQARAKHVACKSFTETIFGAPASVTTLSVTNTKVSADRAFMVTEAITSGRILKPIYYNYLYVVAGTDIYELWDYSGTNDEPFPALMQTLIHRVQALYPHHK